MTYKVGIIGLGVGEAHIQGYQAHPDCEVTALCDFNEDTLKAAAGKYPQMRLTPDAVDILTDPDVQIVSIASYDNFHYEQIMQALAHDKHLFVEKPLCLHEKEARHIKAELEKKPECKISSNLILRKCPRFLALKEKIDGGHMGDIYYVEGDYQYGRLHKITDGWRGKMDFYSVVLGGGVHMIDLLLWFRGKRVKEVMAMGNDICTQESRFKFNDLVTALLKFEDGVVGKMTMNFGCVRPHYHQVSVYGTEATFINQPGEAEYYTSCDPNESAGSMTEAYPGVHKGDLIYEFIEAVKGDREPDVGRKAIFDALSVCFAVDKAVNDGPVGVNYI